MPRHSFDANSTCQLEYCKATFVLMLGAKGIMHIFAYIFTTWYFLLSSRNVPKSKPIKISYIDYKSFNEAGFLRDLEQLDWDYLDTIQDPDTKYLAFKITLKFVFNTHTSNKEKLVKSKSSAWLSPDLKNLIHKRNWLKRKASTALIALHKSGNQTDPANYRPISILPALAKILEKAVHAQLYDYLNRHGILTNHQSGFRKGYSTESALALHTGPLGKEIPPSLCTLT